MRRCNYFFSDELILAPERMLALMCINVSEYVRLALREQLNRDVSRYAAELDLLEQQLKKL